MELGERMRAVREKRGISLSRLAGEIFDAGAETNYDASFIGRVERGVKPAPERLLRAYGRVVAPSLDELPEYHLAMARRLLDEREVGLEQAVANLDGMAVALRGEDVVETELSRLFADVAAPSPRPEPETAPAKRASKAKRREAA